MNGQYESEIINWQKKLELLQQKNTQLKNQVADIIKHDVSVSVLDRMEYFLNNFLNKDAILALLRYDLADQLKSLKKMDNVAPSEILEKTHLKLRLDISKMEHEFEKLKLDFDSYISNFATAS